MRQLTLTNQQDFLIDNLRNIGNSVSFLCETVVEETSLHDWNLKTSWLEQNKWQESRMILECERAEFPARPSESEDLPGSSSRAEDADPREDTEPRVETEVSETGPREVEPTARTSQQPCTQIVLPRHTSVSGMDPSFINYFCEHGMTPYLMESLMTKRGWTLEMVNRVAGRAWLIRTRLIRSSHLIRSFNQDFARFLSFHV